MSIYKNFVNFNLSLIGDRLITESNTINVLKTMKSFLKTSLYIEQTLYQKMYSDTFDLLSLLTSYVEILDSFNETFPVSHGHLVREIANELAIDLSSFDLEKTEQLSQIIREIAHADRHANQKYSELCFRLSKTQNENQAISLLQNYISEESFLFYQNLAIDRLKKLQFSRSSL